MCFVLETPPWKVGVAKKFSLLCERSLLFSLDNADFITNMLSSSSSSLEILVKIYCVREQRTACNARGALIRIIYES